jgi:TfoX N-terminal domain
MPKSPPELIARFDAVVARYPGAVRRQMFGYPALFVGGNLTTSLFADRWVVRLAPDDLAEVLGLPGAARFEPMPGRPMNGYALLPLDVVGHDGTLDSWLRRAIAHVSTLPAK